MIPQTNDLARLTALKVITARRLQSSFVCQGVAFSEDRQHGPLPSPRWIPDWNDLGSLHTLDRIAPYDADGVGHAA